MFLAKNPSDASYERQRAAQEAWYKAQELEWERVRSEQEKHQEEWEEAQAEAKRNSGEGVVNDGRGTLIQRTIEIAPARTRKRPAEEGLQEFNPSKHSVVYSLLYTEYLF